MLLDTTGQSTTKISSQFSKQPRRELAFFKNSAAMRLELSNNARSIMLVMRPATDKKAPDGRPIYDNDKKLIMSLKTPDIQRILYYFKQAPIEDLEPVKLFHKFGATNKTLEVLYNKDNRAFKLTMGQKIAEGWNNSYIVLGEPEVLTLDLVLRFLIPIILGL